MDSGRPFVAHRHFPGPTDPGHCHLGLEGQVIYGGGAAPAVYRMNDLTRGDWKSLWCRIAAQQPLCIQAAPPRLTTHQTVLIFEAPDQGPPITLVGHSIKVDTQRFWVTVVDPSLSWRLAAVDFGKRLPSKKRPGTRSKPTHRSSSTSLQGRRLRLRPDLPGAARDIAPTAPLQRAIIALRAAYLDLDELLVSTATQAQSALPFLAALAAADLIVDAPRPLESTANRFDYLGLHWSAHQALVRRNYLGLEQRLRRQDNSGTHHRALRDAYEVLRSRRGRRTLRRALIEPPVIAEAIRYYGHLMERAIICNQIDRALDLGRRILELDPTRSEIRATIDEIENCPSTPSQLPTSGR